MRFYYINNVDRTSDVENLSLNIINQLQQRADTCNFTIINGSRPSEWEDVKIYDGALVESHTGTQIILQDSYELNVNHFYKNQIIWLKIGNNSSEKAEISSYNEDTRTITLKSTPSITLNKGDKIGELIFGGIVAAVEDKNLDVLNNIIYNVRCVDYTKVFDRVVISNSWENKDCRYIINEFVNDEINYNITIDNLSYSSNSAIQAEWIKSGDANLATINSSDFLEATSSAKFAWTNSTGIAKWTASPSSKDISDLVGVNSGTPTNGYLMLWLKLANYSSINSIKIRIGSSSANYGEATLSLKNTTDWQYISTKFSKMTITGTPDWTNVTFLEIEINENSSSYILANGIRVNDDTSFTLYNVESTPSINDIRSPQLKPIYFINQLAKLFEYFWYIDYERDIHFKDRETVSAPFNISDTSNNFFDLKYNVDVSNLGNRIIVRGGEKTSSSKYSQVFEGDGVKREWLLKNKFKNLSITIDDNSSTDTCETGTTTTTIKATAHGLSVGDHIVNRTRGNAVRQILTVPDADTFTVEAVSGQTAGDTFSKFATIKTIGIEGLVDETTVDYVYNSNEKSVRATNSEPTLDSGTFIRFEYNERIPIQIRYTDMGSVNKLKALGLGHGIFDLDPITDRNIEDLNTALILAQTKVQEFSNPILTFTFKTDKKGLKAGQIIRITETTNRNIDEEVLIQKVQRKLKGGKFKDYDIFTITAGTTLNGLIEFLQKLLATKDKIELNVDEIVETYITALEDLEISDVNVVAVGGINKVTINEDINLNETVNRVTTQTPPWQWETSTGQSVKTRWNLFEWG